MTQLDWCDIMQATCSERKSAMRYFQIKNRSVITFILILVLLAGCTLPVGESGETPVEQPAGQPDQTPGQQSPEPPPIETNGDGPLLWRVTSPDGQTLYLFGSIHAADAELYPLPDAIMDAFSRSDYLAVEFDVVAFEQNAAALAEMSAMLMYTDGRTVVDDIGYELHQRAIALMSELESELESHLGRGFPLELLDAFKPTMWIDLLTAVAIDRSGMSFDYGLDRFFINEANARGMEIIEIESFEDQISMLLGFSVPLQMFLLENVMDIDEVVVGTNKLYELWKAGDIQALEAFLESDTDSFPPELADEYFEAMLTERDIAMVAAAQRYMDEGRKVFYVVGLAHMIGEDGIVGQLVRSGYTVERLAV